MNFVQRRLPWIVAAGALVVYLLTLNRWITFTGLPTASKALGWDWQPMFLTPLLYLLTYPVRWLPESWQLIGLNVFSTICSALTLALLARSVAILPQDRTREQRAFERSEYSFLSIRTAWLPPVLAALVCGLQLSFWENTVVATGESLDLLLFAYCVRCLLEYRIGEKSSWLYRLAVVYGLGITNDFALIAFLPLLVVALVWIKGRGFFKMRFLLNMLGLGLAGLSLYLLLPAINSIGGTTDYSFLEILRTHWGSQRNTLWHFPRFLLIIMGFTSLLPVLFIGIRWPAQYGDISAAGNALANLMMHVVHALFLGACLWVMFDPTFSPRALGHRYGQPWAFLPFYYLAALTVGYCSGYFLLVLGAAPHKPWQRPSLLAKVLKKAVVGVVMASVIGVPAALIVKNLPKLRADLNPYLRQFGVLARQCLPAQGAIVLSDDSYRLFSLKAALRRSGTDKNYVLVNTELLTRSAYHRYLHRQFPETWPQLPPQPAAEVKEVAPRDLIQLLTDLRRSHEIYYLHPSFGYYFEKFYLKPRNLVYLMEAYPTNAVAAPLLTAEEFRANDQFWQDCQEQLQPLRKQMSSTGQSNQKKRSDFSYATFMIGGIYSRCLNFLGVEHQKAGHLKEAADYFASALQFNPKNPSAFINRAYNEQLQAGERQSILGTEEAKEMLQPYHGNIELVLNMNGPIDEPQACFGMSQVFARGHNLRQAMQQLQRAAELDPAYYEARVSLATVYAGNQPDQALQEVANIRAFPALQSVIATNPLPLIRAEALAYAAKKNMDKATDLLHAAQQKYPQAVSPFATEAQIYLANQDVTNALAVLERQIKIQTNKVPALLNYGQVKMQTKAAGEAIPYFTRALEQDPQNRVVLMNRAAACLDAGERDPSKLDLAEKDYQTLLANLSKPPHWVYYGLGEVFFKKKQAEQAIEYYQKYLKLVPKDLPEAIQIQERIKQLKRGSF